MHNFTYRSVLTYVLGAQTTYAEQHMLWVLNETLLSTQSFEYPRHMLWLRNKKINFLFALLKFLLRPCFMSSLGEGIETENLVLSREMS